MIVIMSLWRNDEHHEIHERVKALLSKSCVGEEVAFLWAVGDSTDDTESILREYEEKNRRLIQVVNVDTGIFEEDLVSRRTRLSQSATKMFDALGMYFIATDYACLHESDLISPSDILGRLLSSGGGNPCAGWPVINLTGTPQFYDIWAYRHTNGRYFTPDEKRPDHLIQVHGFGSVWIAPTWMVANRVLRADAIRELCDQWRREGHPMYCDPSIIIEQPVGLWVAR